jgi:hypothetical protein
VKSSFCCDTTALFHIEPAFDDKYAPFSEYQFSLFCGGHYIFAAKTDKQLLEVKNALSEQFENMSTEKLH